MDRIYGSRKLGVYLVAILGAASFPMQGYSVTELGPVVESALAQAKSGASAAMGCMPSPNNPQCSICKAKVNGIVSQLEAAVKAALGGYGAGGTAGAGGVGAKAAAAQQKQSSLAGSLGLGTGDAAGGQGARAAAAGAAASAFRQCSSEVQSACSGVAEANQLTQACEQGASGSDAVAQEKAGTAADMGQLAQMLGQAAQALGPLLAKKEEPEKNTPPSSISSKPPALAAANLGNSGGLKAASISTKTEGGKTAVAGSGSGGFAGPAGAFSSTPELAAALGGSDPGSNAGARVTTAASTSGGGGSLNGSGSSRLADASGEKAAERAASAEIANNYELPTGGGGGMAKPSILGLRGKSSDLGESSDAAGSGTLGDLGITEEGRPLASNDGDVDVGEMDGGTLFRVVHLKIAEFKLRGEI